uniref:FAD-binding PCMH-type domain-containing protein n=1 Tax=Cannabis sativa TaxID=3483 RepID=A0A803QDU7_CANSA
MQNLRFADPNFPKPIAIILPQNVDQIKSVVLCARNASCKIIIRSGGHSYEGTSSTIDTASTANTPVPFVIMDLMNLNRVTVDLEDKSAWVEGGATLGETYYAIANATNYYGFSAGSCPTVGIGGHISGGGFGLLSRKYGVAADNVLDALLVDANGKLLDRESMGEDVFWAIRGGGGGVWGVVYAWKINLLKVPPIVTTFIVSRQGTKTQIANLIAKWQLVAPNLGDDFYLSCFVGAGLPETTTHVGISVTFKGFYLGPKNQTQFFIHQVFPELGIVEQDCSEMSWIQSIVFFSDLSPGSSVHNLQDRYLQNKACFKAKSDYVHTPISHDGIWVALNHLEKEPKGYVILDPYGGNMDRISTESIAFPHRKEIPIKESHDFYEKPTTQLSLKPLVDEIKGLPFKEKHQIITVQKLNGDLGTIFEFNELLLALVVAEEPYLALKLFDEMSSYGLEPDSWTFSVIIRCYCENNDFDEAESVLRYMLDNGFVPNFSAVNILMNSLCKKGKLQRAFGVLDLMGGIGFKPTVQIYNCLLKGLCYVGRVEEAFDMLMRMKKDSIVGVDMYSYTAVMGGFCKVGRSDEAMELLNEALEMSLSPNVVTFNTLFNGFCVEGRPLEGIKILKMMKERDCQPDYISYSTLLHGLLKWRKTKTALRICNEMLEIGLNVDKKMMNSLLRGLCRRFCRGRKEDLFRDAYQFFEKMKNDGNVFESSTYDLVIQTLCIGKKIDEASVSLQTMIRMGFSPQIIILNGVIQALCVEGKANEALFVLVLLNEGGIVPSRGSYNLLIDGLNKHGNFFGACNVYGAAVKRGLIPSKKPQQ